MLRIFTAGLLGAALLAACNKPSPFGADLLDDQLADYAFTDTLTVNYTVIREDSILTSDRSFTADYFLCGQLNDPSFGVSRSDIYSLLQLDNLNPGFKATDVLDSVELILRYDAPGIYGDTSQPVNLRIYRLSDQLRWDEDYYSNESLAAAEELGSLDFRPRPTTLVNNPFDTTSDATKYTYIKVPLNQAFGQMLMGMDSLKLSNDTLFWDELNGLKISVSSPSQPGVMLAFDLNNSLSRIRLHYTRDTNHLSFDYFFAANKFMQFQHDYNGAPAGQQINQLNPDYLYLQGMGGLKLKVEVPYADRFEDIAVNKAELVFSVANPNNDPGALLPADQLVSTESRGDTTFVLTSDVLFSLGITLSGGFAAFGGTPEIEILNNTAVNRYRLTATQRFQDMVDDTSGDVKNRTFYINVYPQRGSAMRTILHGPGSTSYPAKLELKYTRIK